MSMNKMCLAALLILAAPFTFISNALAEDLVPLVYAESFDNGIPLTWTVVDGYGDGLTWNVGSPTDYNLGDPHTEPFTAVLDSLSFGAAFMDEELVSPAYNMSRCVVDNDHKAWLEFANTFIYYAGNLQEVGDVDLSEDNGATWTNVLRMANGNFGPEPQQMDISQFSHNTTHLRVRFHYYNAREEFWWFVDDVKVSCMATPEAPEMTLSCDGFAEPMNKVVVVKGRRPILPLRAILQYEDTIITDQDLDFPPVADVAYTPESYDGEMINPSDLMDVTEVTEGNIFEYNPATEQWYFHLPLEGLASGTYSVTMQSTDTDQYDFAPHCVGYFTLP